MLKLIIGIILLFLVLISAHFVFVEGEESLDLKLNNTTEAFQDFDEEGEIINSNCFESLTNDYTTIYPESCCKHFLEDQEGFLQKYSDYLQVTNYYKDCDINSEKLQKLHKKLVLKCIKENDYSNKVLINNSNKCNEYLNNTQNFYNFKGINDQINEPGLYGCIHDENCILGSEEVNICSSKCNNDIKINTMNDLCKNHGSCYEERGFYNDSNICNSILLQQNCDNTDGCQFDNNSNMCHSINKCSNIYDENTCNSQDGCSYSNNQCVNTSETCYDYTSQDDCPTSDNHCVWITQQSYQDQSSINGFCQPMNCSVFTDRTSCNQNTNCSDVILF